MFVLLNNIKNQISITTKFHERQEKVKISSYKHMDDK